MPKHYRNSRKFKLILAAIAGFTLAGLSWKLGETVVRTCEVIDWIAWIAIVVLRPIISSVWQAFASCFFRQFSSRAVFVSTCDVDLAGAIRPGRVSESKGQPERENLARQPLTNTSKKDTVLVEFPALRSTRK